MQIILGKRITNNIARITRKYEGLFYDKFTITIIKIYDDGKIWDADNRNVKPIQDGLIHEKGFYFGNQYTILIPYHEHGKFLMRNNYAIRHSIYLRIKEMYDVEL